MENETHKSTYIIITLVMVGIIIIYGIYIFISYKNQTGFFEPYVPTPSETSELKFPFKTTPLTKDQIELFKSNKKIILCNACRQILENSTNTINNPYNVYVPVLNTNGTVATLTNITNTSSFCANYVNTNCSN